MVTAYRLRELLDYNQETGVFTQRLNRTGVKAGAIAGTNHCMGYRTIRLEGRDYLAHRLAWLYMTGAWPTHQIDHINGVKDDNCFANLREATHAENNRNTGRRSDNTSGFKGVIFDRRNGGRWRAYIQKNGRMRHIGGFDTPEEAHKAYCEAAREHHGEFARTE
jgi:hypothetical protein